MIRGGLFILIMAASLILPQGSVWPAERGAAVKPTPHSTPSLPVHGKYHALIIGNNNYKHLPKLKTAIVDAREVNEVLKNRYNFDTKPLIDASRKDILDALNELRKRVGKLDNVLIYYAGHGEYDKEAQKAYWLPVDAQRDSTTEWIIADDITASIKRMAAKHIIIVSDSCYSGTLTRTVSTDLSSKGERDEYLRKMLDRPSRTLMASGGNEPVSDSGGGAHSVFAAAFLRALNEADKPLFTAEELFHGRVKTIVAGKADQVPEYNDIRNSGHEGGDFIFVASRIKPGIASDAPSYTAVLKQDQDSDTLQLEKDELERERQELARQKEELEQRKALAAERERLLAERQRLKGESEALEREQSRHDSPSMQRKDLATISPGSSGKSESFTKTVLSGKRPPISSWSPGKPVTIVVPFAPGGATDILGRTLAGYLQPSSGWQVVIANKPGAGGAIGAAYVAQGKPDGTTLLLANSALMTMTKALQKDLPFNPESDLVPVIQLAKSPLVLVIRANTSSNLGRMATQPLKFASAGVNSMSHLTGEALKQVVSAPWSFIPYMGTGPAIAALLGGHVDATFSDAATVAPHVKDGKLEALALTGDKRSSVLPNVRTFDEIGIRGMNMTSWYGLFARRGTPPEAVARWYHETAKGMGDSQVLKSLDSMSINVAVLPPNDLADVVRTESAFWSRLVQTAGISLK